MAVTPHGVLPRDSHEISPNIGGGTQVDYFTKGFSKGNITNTFGEEMVGGQGDPDARIKLWPNKLIGEALSFIVYGITTETHAAYKTHKHPAHTYGWWPQGCEQN